MEETFVTQYMWVTIMVGTVVGLVVLAKAPELLVAMLIVGTNIVQYVLRLLGFDVDRRTFAFTGGVIFIPIVLLFLVMRMLQKREREPIIGRPNIPFVVLSMLMGLVLLFGLTYTLTEIWGERKTGEYFMFGMAPMLLAFVFLRDRASAHRFLMWVILVTAGTVVTTSIYSYVTQGSFFHVLGYGGRETMIGGGLEVTGHLALSNALVITMSAILGSAAARKTPAWRAMPIVALPLIGLYVMLAGTRSNLVAFTLVVFFGFYYVYKKNRAVLAAALLVVLITAGVLLLVIPDDVRDRMFSSWIEAGTEHGYGGAARVEYIKAFPGQFVQAPLVGHGTGGWAMLHSGFDVMYDFPHNMFVEIAVENGLLGLGVLLALWFIVIGRVWHCLHHSELGTDSYGFAVFGACLLAIELATALAHFGIAHGSCSFLITSAITLRVTFLAEQTEVSQERLREEGVTLVRPVLRGEHA